MLAGRASRRDATYLVVLGIFLLVSDWALVTYADPKIDLAPGRTIVTVLLAVLAALGVAAVVLGCYRFVRPAPREEREVRP